MVDVLSLWDYEAYLLSLDRHKEGNIKLLNRNMKYGFISVENLDQFGGLVLNFGDCIANGLWELARYTFILITLDSVLIYPETILSFILFIFHLFSDNKTSLDLAKYS
jgi:hypothetical protein